MRYFLGLDNGGTTTKAAIYDEHGTELAMAGSSTELRVPQIGFAEQDMEELWQRNCRVVRMALERSGLQPRDIACVACCGHGKGMYLWGSDGRPACPGISSVDNRAWEYPVQWAADGTEARAFALSKQHVLASQPVALLAWMRDHRPEVLARSRYVFGCKDYVRFRLTGEACFERSDASGCNLMNLDTCEYDPELLRLFGLEACARLLPPLRNAVDICGCVTAEAAEATGLAAGTPVAGGAFDIDACAAAARVFDGESLCMIAGTWSINEYVASAPVTDGTVKMNSCFCVPGRYLVEESSPTSAGNLEWLIDTMLPELRSRCAAEGRSIYEIINRWVAEAEEAPCPIFLPFLMGSNVHPLAAGTFIGLNRYHGRKHMARAVYEGVAFSHRFHYERLLQSMPHPPRVIRLTGGANRSAVWSQMFADVMKCPVEAMDVNEAGTLGCAIFSAAAAGAYSSLEEAAGNMSRVARRFEPDRSRYTYYDQQYNRYRRALQLLDPIWGELDPQRGEHRPQGEKLCSKN